MGGQEPLEPADAFELAELLPHALLERPVPLRELSRLRLHRIVQGLDPQHRLDPGHQGGLVDGLRQVFVAARLEAGDDVLGVGFGGDRDDRHERERRIRFDPPADFHPVHLGHHDIQQDQVRLLRSRERQGFFAVGGREDLIPVGGEAGLEDVQVHGVVVRDENPRRRSHGATAGTGGSSPGVRAGCRAWRRRRRSRPPWPSDRHRSARTTSPRRSGCGAGRGWL